MDQPISTQRQAAAAPRRPTRHNPIWELKLRLQFTGWLQYIANGLLALVFLAAAGTVGLVGAVLGVDAAVLVWPLLVVGLALLAVLAFDLVTIKAGIHPPEALPLPRAGLDAFDLMRARRSCRSFQRRNLRAEDRDAVLASARRHSQASGLLGGRPIRFEYIPASLTVWPVVGAHEFLVAIAPAEYDRTAILDVGRSLQRVVLDATRMGLATCWIGPGADHRSILRALGDRFDPERDHIVCVCAVGYPSRYLPFVTRLMALWMHRRRPLEQLFFAGADFRTPLDTSTAPYARFGRCFEVCQWSPSSYNGQQARCAAVEEPGPGVEHRPRFDFAAATASRYYAPIAVGIWLANWEAGCEALGIPGHAAVLTGAARGVSDPPALPRYDVSWIADPAGAVAAA